MWTLYIHFSLLAINSFLWMLFYRHLGRELRLLGLVLLLTSLFECYAAHLMFLKIRNLYIYHLLTPLQYILYTLIFYVVLEARRQKQLVLLSIPVYLVISLLISLYFQELSEYNSYALSIRNVLLTCWTLLYYKDIFTGLKIGRLNREPMFWVSTGLLFYSLGSFFIDGLMNYVLGKSRELASALFYISIFLGYLLYITCLVAFILEARGKIRLENPKFQIK